MTRKTALLLLLTVTGCGTAATQGASPPLVTPAGTAATQGASPPLVTPAGTAVPAPHSATSPSITVRGGSQASPPPAKGPAPAAARVADSARPATGAPYPIGQLAPWAKLLAERFPAPPAVQSAVLKKSAAAPAVVVLPAPLVSARRPAMHRATSSSTPAVHFAPVRAETRPHPIAATFGQLKARTDQLLGRWKRHQVSTAPLRALATEIKQAAAHAKPKTQRQLARLSRRLAAALKPVHAATKPATRVPGRHSKPRAASHKASPKVTPHAKVKPHAKPTSKSSSKPKARVHVTKRPRSARH